MTDEEFFDANEAAAYLAKRWEKPGFNVEALKKLRQRWNLQPAKLLKNASVWRKSDLDEIPKPGTLPRKRRTRKEIEEARRRVTSE